MHDSSHEQDARWRKHKDKKSKGEKEQVAQLDDGMCAMACEQMMWMTESVNMLQSTDEYKRRLAEEVENVRKMMAGMEKQATGGDLQRVAEMEESLKKLEKEVQAKDVDDQEMMRNFEDKGEKNVVREGTGCAGLVHGRDETHRMMREEERRAQEAREEREREASAHEERTEQDREVEAQGGHESEVKAQGGHDSEVKAQGGQEENANSLHEECHVSNGHMTWWHNAWWIRVHNGPHMRRRRVWRAARRAAEQARDEDRAGEAHSLAEEAEGERWGRKQRETDIPDSATKARCTSCCTCRNMQVQQPLQQVQPQLQQQQPQQRGSYNEHITGTSSSFSPTSSCSPKLDSLCSSVELGDDTCTDCIYTHWNTFATALPAVFHTAPVAAVMYAAPGFVTYAAPALVDYLMACTRSRNGLESLILCALPASRFLHEGRSTALRGRRCGGVRR